MTRRRRGSSRRPANAAQPRDPREPRPVRPPPADGRTRAGTATRNRAISPVWLAIGAALTVGLAIALLFGPRLISGLGSGAGASASGQTASGCPTSQPPALPAGEARTATIRTELGDIAIRLEADLSPIAVGNFVALAECGFYDGVVFHRTPTLPDGTPFVIQGGDPEGTGRGGPGYEIQDEPVTRAYARGVVAMARTQAPNSVGSQFFIVLDEGARPALESANTYQIIGTVTAGMEVADAIHARAGGQELPTDPVVMQDVTISEA